VEQQKEGLIVNTSEILFAAMFCFAMVFVLLGGLYVLVKLSTIVIRTIETKAKKGGG